MKRTNKALALAAIVALPMSDAFTLAPPQKMASQVKSIHLQASSSDDNGNRMVPLAKQALGGAMTFMTGLGVAAQIAFADPSNVVAAPIVGTCKIKCVLNVLKIFHWILSLLCLQTYIVNKLGFILIGFLTTLYFPPYLFFIWVILCFYI